MVLMRWFVGWSIWLLDSIFLIILSVEWGKGRGQILRCAQDDSLSFVILSASEGSLAGPRADPSLSLRMTAVLK